MLYHVSSWILLRKVAFILLKAFWRRLAILVGSDSRHGRSLVIIGSSGYVKSTGELEMKAVLERVRFR